MVARGVLGFALALAGCQFDGSGSRAGDDSDDDDILPADASPLADAGDLVIDASHRPDAQLPDAGPPCPDSFTEGDFGCYLLLDFRTWDANRIRCGELGGYLAKIDSSAEDQWVRDHVEGDFDLWIGLNDRASEGVYKWVDGTALGTFQDWDLDEPNDGGAHQENCVEFRVSFIADGWNDQGCDEVRQGLCERDKGH